MPCKPRRGPQALPTREPFTGEKLHELLLLNKVFRGNDARPRATDLAIAMLALHLDILHWKVKSWTGPLRDDLERGNAIATAIWDLTELLPAYQARYAAIADGLEYWSKTPARTGPVNSTELEQAKKTTPYPQHYAGAQTEEGKKLVEDFNEKYSGKKLTAQHELERKVTDLREMKAKVDALNLLDGAGKARADIAVLDALITAARAARERGLPVALDPMVVMSEPAEKWKDFAENLQAAFHELLPGRSKEAGYRFIQVVTPAITGEEPTVGAIKIWLKEPDRRVRRLGQTSA
jgi:hypothetical protein